MPKSIFKTIETTSLVDKVEASIVELLQEQKLKVGDSIPKELELTEILGVSRTVIREALLRLRMMGLIESKKKKGSIITSPDIFGNLSKSMNPHILDQDTLKEIFEIRLVLEIGMAEFDSEHEIEFHGKLYEITGNETLKKFQRMLLPIFNYVHNSGLLKKQTKIKKFVSHKGLVEIMENGSPELFRNAMRNHLENHFARLFE
jgi:DNA-binding FadR family transcriptional regulator